MLLPESVPVPPSESLSAPKRLRTRVARDVLRASGLPSLGPVLLPPDDARRYDRAADMLVAGGEVPQDVPLLELLRWFAQRSELLFHGSRRGDLTVLEPIRLSRDTSEFGDRQAIFASSDPVWAIYFATLRREELKSTRNASLGVPGVLYPRWYFFSHDEDATAEWRFDDGWLYVLPREGFEPEAPSFGVLDTAHWVSPTPVTPLAAVAVSRSHFPFVQHVVSHRPEESLSRTMLRAARHARRARRRGAHAH
jgi:hypothetical protein